MPPGPKETTAESYRNIEANRSAVKGWGSIRHASENIRSSLVASAMAGGGRTSSLSGLEFKDSNMKNTYKYGFAGLYGFLIPKPFRENHDFTL